MKKSGVLLLAVLLLVACSKESKVENKSTSSSSSIQQAKSSSSMSKSSSSSSKIRLKSASSTEVNSGAALSSESLVGEQAASSQQVSQGVSATESVVTSETSPVLGGEMASAMNVGDALVSGDFSSVAGTWQDEYGNQITMGADGSLQIRMASGDHISEEARENLSRDLYVLNGYGSWDGATYVVATDNGYTTSALPRFSIDTQNGTVALVPNGAETYSGTFSRVE